MTGHQDTRVVRIGGQLVTITRLSDGSVYIAGARCFDPLPAPGPDDPPDTPCPISDCHGGVIETVYCSHCHGTGVDPDGGS